MEKIIKNLKIKRDIYLFVGKVKLFKFQIFFSIFEEI